MSNLRITNVSNQTMWFRDLYTEIRPGQAVDIKRTPAEIADMQGVQQQLQLGTITVDIVFLPFELPNDLVSIWPLGKNWRPTVPTAADLPYVPDNRFSDIRITADTLSFNIWDGVAWVPLGGGGGGGPPTGPAGGVLTGTYPNPGLAANTVGPLQLQATGVVAATYGSASQVPIITVDVDGRITVASTAAIAGGPPSGPAGGDLVGTYPNPTLAATAVVAGTYGSIDVVPIITVDSKGRLTNVATASTLLQLIRFISEGPTKGFATGATKTVTGTVFPSQTLWRRADTTKLVEKNVTYTGSLPTTIQWILYAADGITVLENVVDTVTYAGVFEASRVRFIS